MHARNTCTRAHVHTHKHKIYTVAKVYNMQQCLQKIMTCIPQQTQMLQSHVNHTIKGIYVLYTAIYFGWEKPEVHVAIKSFIDGKETCTHTE